METVLDRQSNVRSASSYTRDDNGQVIEKRVQRRGNPSPEGERVTRTVYCYDARGNWIESTWYDVHANQEEERPQPLFRMYRDITYMDRASNTQSSIEPGQLFPRKEQVPGAEP